MTAASFPRLTGRMAGWIALLSALLLCALILWPHTRPPAPVDESARPIAPRPLPSGMVAARSLFLDPVATAGVEPRADAPALVGIAGRLPDDAVAMIRGDDGTTRTLALGQVHRGWRLDSLSTDAALFTRGSQRLRVALPPADDQPEPETGE